MKRASKTKHMRGREEDEDISDAESGH